MLFRSASPESVLNAKGYEIVMGETVNTHDTLVAGGGLYAKMWQDYQTSVSWKVGAAK